MSTKEQTQARLLDSILKQKSEFETPTLSVEERLHRIHVLTLDLEVAMEEKDYLSIPFINEEMHHYATTNTYATNSGRWETQ